VICLANVVFIVSIGMLDSSRCKGSVFSRHLSLEIWQLVDGTFALDTFGGNDILLINAPISELCDSCYKN